jgi:hypothetical protein
MVADTPGDDVVSALAARVPGLPPSVGAVRLVGIDGYAGSGKTTLAAALAARLGGAPVVALDDFASFEDFFGWVPRLRHGVLDRFRAGRPGRYPVYDWWRARFGAVTEVNPAPVVLLEGVGATRRELDADLAYRIWLAMPRERAIERAIRRDGPGLDAFWRDWRAAEDVHFGQDPSWERADAVIDTLRNPPRLASRRPVPR